MAGDHVLWLLPKRVGKFDIDCSQYCGTGHSLMRGSLVVMGQPEYQAWEQAERRKLQAGAQTPAGRGKALFESNGCAGCHSIDGSPKVGPTLKGVFGRTVQLADGKKMTADDDYLKDSLEEPNEHIVKGFQPIMPSFKTLKPDQIADLIEYLKTLK